MALTEQVVNSIRREVKQGEQYGVVTLLSVRGSVRLEGEQMGTIPVWRSIASIDPDLGLSG
jgi:hypothetical protein